MVGAGGVLGKRSGMLGVFVLSIFSSFLSDLTGESGWKGGLLGLSEMVGLFGGMCGKSFHRLQCMTACLIASRST